MRRYAAEGLPDVASTPLRDEDSDQPLSFAY
jgi:hypothetical protein